MAETIRYRATSRYVYAYALFVLVELAREWKGPVFEFGPDTLDALEDRGLEVTGDDLSFVTDALARAPGLDKTTE